MNQEWSQMNKMIQVLIRKEDTFQEGIRVLLLLRDKLMNEIVPLQNELERKDFDAMPFINANGYHNKTIAYSLWHIFRIEDIVVHTLMQENEQVVFKDDFVKRIGAPINTTGNELKKEKIAQFSERIDIHELFAYGMQVKADTDAMLLSLCYQDTKTNVSAENKDKLISKHVVSEDEHAYWLIDYWCNKDFAGLIRMPLSRHWIMHVQAILRIKEKLAKGRNRF